MSGSSNIVSFGFGAWSGVNYVPTLGMGIGAAPTVPGSQSEYPVSGCSWSEVTVCPAVGSESCIGSHLPAEHSFCVRK